MCFVASLTAAAKTTIEGMLAYYGGSEPGQTPGVFNEIQGYYWWMAGAAWNVFTPHYLGSYLCVKSLMQYWWLTGDTEYNDLVTTAML